jgi:hypothetical protein
MRRRELITSLGGPALSLLRVTGGSAHSRRARIILCGKLPPLGRESAARRRCRALAKRISSLAAIHAVF